jgi:uncharacterized membrane protein
MSQRSRAATARAAIAICALLLGAATTRAQTPGDNLRVYLITFGPGDAVWERFGHNAIAVHDELPGNSVAYNWGMFSFDQPGFVPRLMKGRMLYWTQGFETNWFMNLYVTDNRSIWVQELNLTPAQRVAMRDFVEWNARDENKFYLYDYYRDNCSTRVRDAIDRVTGGALQRSLTARTTESTYRSHTQALTYTDPLTYAGLMLAMGPRIDVPLNEWEEGFIPMQLREAVRHVSVPTADGAEQPLVRSEQTVFEAKRAPLADTAPRMVVPFTVAGILFATLLWLLSRSASHRLALALAVALALFSSVVGLFGTLITLLWAFTDHVVTYRNENVLQANPLSLGLAVLAPAAVLGKAWARRWAVWLSLFVAGCSALGFFIQALPQLDQVNGEIIGLLLPVHGAVAYILWQRWRVDLREL